MLTQTAAAEAHVTNNSQVQDMPISSHSSRHNDTDVVCTRNTYGDRCFAAAGPWVWNSLPAELRQCDSLGEFKRRLKTYLFGISDHSAL